jgi:hypothetical protein
MELRYLSALAPFWSARPTAKRHLTKDVLIDSPLSRRQGLSSVKEARIMLAMWPSLPGFKLEDVNLIDDECLLVARSNTAAATCPICKQKSELVHGLA